MSIQRVQDSYASRKDISVYERYKIETAPAPPRRKQAHPFNPRVSKTGLASMLIHEAFEYGLKLSRGEYRRTLLSRPCIYGVFSGRFGGFHPIKEKCTGCMRCVQEFPAVCTVDRNPVFYNSPDPYWTPEDPSTASGSPSSTVSFEAETGKIPIRGMGYKGPFAGQGWDSMWTDMSEIVRPTRDGVYGREYISTIVDFGKKPGFIDLSRKEFNLSKTIEIALPIIFDHLPASLNSQLIQDSIAGAAARTGSMFIATPEQAKHLLSTHSQWLIPLIKPQETSKYHDFIKNARTIELTQCDSTVLDEVKRINNTAPICVRLQLSDNPEKNAVALAEAGVDVIHLVADYHGKATDGKRADFIKDTIRSVHGALVKESLRDQITIMASGGITLAEHVPKAIICGADLAAIDTTVLVALQLQFDGECRNPTTGKIIKENFPATWGEQRLVNLLAAWHDQLIEILSAMGIRDVRRLRGDVGRAMFNEDLEKEAFADIARE